MGKSKIKKRKFTKADIKKLKDKAVSKEAFELEEECKVAFGEDYMKAISKLIELDVAVEEKGIRDKMAIDRIDLYEILMDNSIEEIIEYYEEEK